MEIMLASGNAHKRADFARMLPSWDVLLPKERGIEFSCEENGTTFIDNALIKARALFRVAPKGTLILADDSGLCVDALDGQPGIHTARYGMEPGGKELPSGQRNALLLRNMEAYKEMSQRSAHFVCAIALIADPYRTFVVQEAVDGHIAFTPYGKGGFGYDPIFICDEIGQSMAAASDALKDQYSHRGRALNHLARLLEEIRENTKTL